jgi:hypothetical protein
MYGDEIGCPKLRTKHSEGVDLPCIPSIAQRPARIGNACLEDHTPVPESASFALDADQAPIFIKRQVVSLLAPRDKNRLPNLRED